MSDIAIKVEGLGKKYTIQHEQGGRYKTLRDTMASTARTVLNRIKHPLTPYDRETAEEFWALKDVSFDIKQGDRVGIIGRNGAGKSTLLKVLSRITEPSTGKITINGRVASLLEVGTGFHPELSGRENIYLNGAILGMKRSEIKRKFDEIVDFAEVEKFLDTPVKRYSSGMYVRLAFAVAAHLEPEILVVDEVLAVGDAQFQKKCLGKMEDVSKNEGRTILFVSHNMAAVQHLCDRGIVLSNGNVAFDGTARDAVDSYISANTNRKIGIQADGFIDLEQAREKVYLEKLFRRIRLIDGDKKPCDTFPMLSPMTIEVELQNTQQYKDADYSIAIHSASGQRLTVTATWMYPGKKKLASSIVFSVPSLRFSPGHFTVQLSATMHSAGYYIDRIESAASFSIEPIDVFNSGQAFTADCGLVLPDGRIELI